MKKLYFAICGQYKNSEKPKTSYLIETALSIISSKCKNEKHKSRITVKNLDQTKNYLTEERNQDELMSKRHKKVDTTINYIEDFLILASTITGGGASISSFTF